MTNAEQIQDLKRKAQNKSLPASAVAALNKMIAELEKSEPKKSSSTNNHYISFLDKKKNFKQTDKVFVGADSYDKAVAWGKKNLENFNYDMIKIGKGKTTKSDKPKKEKTKTSYKASGKDVDEMDCEELEKLFKARKAKAKKSEKKSKTRPVIEKIVSNVATATKQAIDSVSVEDIKKDPKKFIEKCMKAEKSGEEFINDLKSLLGEEYDKSEVSEGMEKILIHIKELKAKYVK
jgi:hypothetical protein